MGALSWIYQLWQTDGSINDRFESFGMLDPATPYGTIIGLRALFEILQVVEDGIQAHFPYYTDFPVEGPGLRDLTRVELWRRIFTTLSYSKSSGSFGKRTSYYSSSYLEGVSP